MLDQARRVNTVLSMRSHGEQEMLADSDHSALKRERQDAVDDQ
jgi:hypothetical protein